MESGYILPLHEQSALPLFLDYLLARVYRYLMVGWSFVEHFSELLHNTAFDGGCLRSRSLFLRSFGPFGLMEFLTFKRLVGVVVQLRLNLELSYHETVCLRSLLQ